MTDPVIVGAVLYDPKVSVIWDIIRDFFDAQGSPIDVVYYTNYELQVAALLNGHLDVAWNSPLAWLDAQRRSGDRCRAIAMRDTDRDRVSHLVVRRDGGIDRLADLRGKRIAVGAKDSPQATLIPLGLLQRNGLEPGRDFETLRFDVLVGKHGDHIGGEREAFQALADGAADASAMLDLNWATWTADGTIDPERYRVLATTDRFDHCVFTVRDDLPAEVERAWLDALFAMSYDDPAHREMMDLEGLKQWLPGRTSGFGPLTEAVARQRFFADGAA
jgi:ABC-type phosphate/phosphonate transport system substrate-binding protein